LIVAHPGHELVVHHWVELHRPIYFCLTDGSGGLGAPRTRSTSRLLLAAGAAPGPIFSRYTDREMYQFLLEGRHDVFLALRDELAESLIAGGTRTVAGDAMEGFNPVHDVCRALIDAAVAVVEAHTGRAVHNVEFSLDRAAAGSETIELDAGALERKLAAARAYPEMADEVERAIAQFGVQSFAREHLRPSSLPRMLEEFAASKPGYETLGESRVKEGRYRDVIRHREHVLPVFEALGFSLSARGPAADPRPASLPAAPASGRR
jgi:hypothetical protein